MAKGKQGKASDIRVGDTVSLGDFPYSTATVVRVYCTPRCGIRIDLVRPYVLMVGDGVSSPLEAVTGTEPVEFVDPANVEMVRRVPRA